MGQLATRHQMSPHRLVAVLLAGVLAGGLAGAVLAAPPRTGSQINLLTGPPATFAADTPFWIGHGWCLTQEELDEGLVDSTTDIVRRASRFELFVDDVAVPLATDLQMNVEPCLVHKINFHNFRFGLSAGLHIFRGEFYLAGEPYGDTIQAGIVFE